MVEVYQIAYLQTMLILNAKKIDHSIYFLTHVGIWLIIYQKSLVLLRKQHN